VGVVRQCKKPATRSSTFVFSESFTQRQKTKELALPNRYELNNVENFRNKTGELKQKLLNLPKLSR